MASLEREKFIGLDGQEVRMEEVSPFDCHMEWVYADCVRVVMPDFPDTANRTETYYRRWFKKTKVAEDSVVIYEEQKTPPSV